MPEHDADSEPVPQQIAWTEIARLAEGCTSFARQYDAGTAKPADLARLRDLALDLTRQFPAVNIGDATLPAWPPAGLLRLVADDLTDAVSRPRDDPGPIPSLLAAAAHLLGHRLDLCTDSPFTAEWVPHTPDGTALDAKE